MTQAPAIYITLPDYDRLSEIVSHTATTSIGPALLDRELERAHIVEVNSSRRFVRLNSRVEFEDLTSSRTRTVRLVLPNEADIDRGQISVLSPVGAALLGLPEGRTFEWKDRDGRPHGIRVISIV